MILLSAHSGEAMESSGIQRTALALATAAAFTLSFSACRRPASDSATGREWATPYLHKNARLGLGLPEYPDIFKAEGRFPIDPRAAARFAVDILRGKGVQDPVICESRWIAAPLSGYLVDALGRLKIGRKDFTTFRVGVRDGCEARQGLDFAAGKEFVFIAFGCDTSGQAVWYPEPGPDYLPAPDEAYPEGLLSFEFLLHRPEFEGLSVRYGF
jgi:hypothetical protein